MGQQLRAWSMDNSTAVDRFFFGFSLGLACLLRVSPVNRSDSFAVIWSIAGVSE